MNCGERVALAGLACSLLGVTGFSGQRTKAEQDRLNRELAFAVYRSDIAAAKRLIGQGANVNALDTRYRPDATMSILYMAAAMKYPRMVELLIRSGARIDRPDQRSPLFSAEDPETVKVLLKHGADSNAKDETGWRPLFTARQEVARALLEGGADINATDDSGNTALMNVVGWSVSAPGQGEHRAHVRLLISRGAKVNHKNRFGESAISIAKARGRNDLVKLLKQSSRKR